MLEELDKRRASGVFATHLHELLDLPLRLSDRVSLRRMGVVYRPLSAGSRGAGGGGGEAATGPVQARTRVEPVWTYQLEHGVSTDSMALATGRRFGLSDRLLDRAQHLAGAFDAACRPQRLQRPTGPRTIGSDHGGGNRECDGINGGGAFSAALGASSGIPVDTFGSDDPFADPLMDPLIDPLMDPGLALAARLLRSSVGPSSVGPLGGVGPLGASNLGPVVHVPARWSPPQSLAGSRSVVYVLAVPAARPSALPSSAPSTACSSGLHHHGRVGYYVGETDGLAGRLATHRRRKPSDLFDATLALDPTLGGTSASAAGGGCGWAWGDAECLAVGCGGKSGARALETSLIKALSAAGLPLLSASDGAHTQFAR